MVKLKFFIISIIINILLVISIGYFLIDSSNVKAIKNELKNKNEQLNIEKEKLKKENIIFNDTIKDKEKSIKKKDIKLNDNLIEIRKLKLKIKKIKLKDSQLFENLDVCKINFNELQLNCLKIEEQNNKYELSLELCLQNKEEMRGVIGLQKRIINNKNIEIELEEEKNLNLQKAIDKIIIANKKPKFLKNVLKIIIVFGVGYLTGAL